MFFFPKPTFRAGKSDDESQFSSPDKFRSKIIRIYRAFRPVYRKVSYLVDRDLDFNFFDALSEPELAALMQCSLSETSSRLKFFKIDLIPGILEPWSQLLHPF